VMRARGLELAWAIVRVRERRWLSWNAEVMWDTREV
jgi:hypothetical protein